MKTTMSLTSFTALSALALLALSQHEGFPQKPSTRLKNYEPILENETVRVGRVTLEAGDSDGLHVHPYPRVLVCIEGATIEVQRQDGSVERTTYRPGDARYQSNTDPHEPVNVGKTRFEGVVIELKK